MGTAGHLEHPVTQGRARGRELAGQLVGPALQRVESVEGALSHPLGGDLLAQADECLPGADHLGGVALQAPQCVLDGRRDLPLDHRHPADRPDDLPHTAGDLGRTTARLTDGRLELVHPAREFGAPRSHLLGPVRQLGRPVPELLRPCSGEGGLGRGVGECGLQGPTRTGAVRVLGRGRTDGRPQCGQDQREDQHHQRECPPAGPRCVRGRGDRLTRRVTLPVVGPVVGPAVRGLIRRVVRPVGCTGDGGGGHAVDGSDVEHPFPQVIRHAPESCSNPSRSGVLTWVGGLGSHGSVPTPTPTTTGANGT
ncbi:hypothetical protein GJR88_00778 [Dietzia sp. DQ12-45-1b]|nr:hypothetical protein GJR88_00778 [Dietzia sp. DQ12-45-1b]